MEAPPVVVLMVTICVVEYVPATGLRLGAATGDWIDAATPEPHPVAAKAKKKSEIQHATRKRYRENHVAVFTI
jgi:hypothetical protein